MQLGLSPNFTKNWNMSSRGSPASGWENTSETHSKHTACAVSKLSGSNPVPSCCTSGQLRSLSRLMSSRQARYGPLRCFDSFASSVACRSFMKLMDWATEACTSPSEELQHREKQHSMHENMRQDVFTMAHYILVCSTYTVLNIDEIPVSPTGSLQCSVLDLPFPVWKMLSQLNICMQLTFYVLSSFLWRRPALINEVEQRVKI